MTPGRPHRPRRPRAPITPGARAVLWCALLALFAGMGLMVASLFSGVPRSAGGWLIVVGIALAFAGSTINKQSRRLRR